MFPLGREVRGGVTKVNEQYWSKSCDKEKSDPVCGAQWPNSMNSCYENINWYQGGCMLKLKCSQSARSDPLSQGIAIRREMRQTSYHPPPCPKLS